MMQAPLPSFPAWVPVRTLAVVVAVLLSTALLLLLSDRTERLVARLRSRLVLGVPWGALLTITGVLLVYLLVQGAIDGIRDPLVIPFRSWSYYYPLGMVTAAFSHSSLGHITGNLVGTAMFAPIAEYAWGHYPRRRGTQTFTSPLTNPIARILLVPLAVLVVGLFTALFALGPVVGFSGVVFAFAGFALVQRPTAAALAILADRVLGLVVTAIQNPRVVAIPRPRVITPWWANIAIQGHAIGLFAGILLGFGLAYYRDRWPEPTRLWFGLLAFAAVQGLWALFVPQGGGRYVMFRWLGTAVVFVLAAVVVLAVSGEYDLGPVADLSVAGVLSRETGRVDLTGALSVVSLVGVLVLTTALSAVAIPYNVAPVGQADAPGDGADVRDYTVTYAEDVPDGYVGSVSIPLFESATAVNTSGVIVTSERRHIWQTVVLDSQLKNRGFATVEVGGLGWRRDVYVNRTGWKPTGNDSVYNVYVRPSRGNRTLAFTSAPRRAEPVIGGRNVTVRATGEGFWFRVSMANRTLGTAPLPGPGRTTTAGGITFVRNASNVVATYNRTRLRIVTRTGSGTGR